MPMMENRIASTMAAEFVDGASARDVHSQTLCREPPHCDVLHCAWVSTIGLRFRGCWQSDFTHWTMADGSDVEILNWPDDHSRFLLACIAYRRVSGPDVVASFAVTAKNHGLPASTLTNNGSVYTSRFTHGYNDFERLLASLGITQKNGKPRKSPNPRQNRRLPPNPQALAGWLADADPPP